MVDGSGLENRRGRKSSVGSNPTLASTLVHQNTGHLVDARWPFCYIFAMLWIFIVCLILAFMVVVNAHLKNYAKAVRKINMAKYMTKGWDGYDADPINKYAIRNMVDLVRELRHPLFYIADWEVFPTGRGSLQIERKFGNMYVEVEVYSNRFAVFARYPDNGITEFEVGLDKLPTVVNFMKSHQGFYWLNRYFWFPKN